MKRVTIGLALGLLCLAAACGTNGDDDGGLKADGQSCAANAECSNVCIEGLCAALAADGEACDEVADCASGLTCTDGSCVAAPKVDGEACLSNAECVNVCIDEACAPISGLAGACDETGDCSIGLECIAGLCAVPPPKANGEDCTVNAECINVCIDGSCASRSAVDGACDEGADCAAGLTCASNVCTASGPKADGESCTNNTECINVCIDSLCSPRSDVSGTCDENADCAAGLTCNAGVCGSPSVSCNAAFDQADACGGEVTGTWQAAAACGNGTFIDIITPYCASATLLDEDYTISGSIIFLGGFVDRSAVSIHGQLVVSIPKTDTCAMLGCEGIETAVNNQGMGTAACTDTGMACECTVAAERTGGGSTSYTTSAGVITTGDGDTWYYCVDGSQITARQFGDNADEDFFIQVYSRQ